MNSIKAYLEKHPKETQRLLGINDEQLQQILLESRKYYSELQEIKERNKVRIIKSGGGRKPSLSLEEQVLLTLIYLHQYPSFQMLGIQFGVSETTAHEIFHKWVKYLSDILPSSLLEQIKKKQGDSHLIQEVLSNFELTVDSYEQPIQKPCGYKESKKFYSSKKSNFTMKDQIIMFNDGSDIVDTIVGKPGPNSDINLWREQAFNFDNNQRFVGDKAYVGEPQIETPIKKPKGGQLTAKQKENNRQISRKRIGIEHLIRKCKVFRIASERFRLSLDKYEGIIKLIYGLVRFRIGGIVL